MPSRRRTGGLNSPGPNQCLPVEQRDEPALPQKGEEKKEKNRSEGSSGETKTSNAVPDPPKEVSPRRSIKGRERREKGTTLYNGGTGGTSIPTIRGSPFRGEEQEEMLEKKRSRAYLISRGRRSPVIIKRKEKEREKERIYHYTSAEQVGRRSLLQPSKGTLHAEINMKKKRKRGGKNCLRGGVFKEDSS